MRIRLPLLVVPALMVLVLPSCQIFKKNGNDLGDPLAMDYPFDAQGNYIEKGAKKTGSGSPKPVVASNNVPPPLAPDHNYQPIRDNPAPPPPPPPLSGGGSTKSGSSKPKSGGTASTSSKPKAATSSYTVRQGDTLSTIASAHGTSVSSLRSANGISGDVIRVGQQLRVPSGSGRVATTSSGGSKSGGTKSGGTKSGGTKSSGGATSSGGSYTVKSGDSLWTIARKNNTTVAKLKSANDLSSDNLKIGQKLKMP